MRVVLMLSLAITAFAFVPSSAEAAKNKSNNVIIYQNDGSYVVQQRPVRKGPLARMWELEQRKNAWLKRTFLGR